MLKENEYYTCITCMTIDSVMRMEKENYPQVYLEECKYRMEKKKNDQIHRNWTRIRVRARVRTWYWIRTEILVTIWHWIIVTFLFSVVLFWTTMDGCLLTLTKSKNLVVIFRTLNKSKILVVILLLIVRHGCFLDSFLVYAQFLGYMFWESNFKVYPCSELLFEFFFISCGCLWLLLVF